ncbi:D-tagatose-bisphosphate aldolase, class II, non-catalytic subunit [Falsihalocynthiibacter arcticus]|uniref:D-tagatose-bisphosphate aldolase, class II, non-catalytic subunit n=1 Tax=Falsihalocynthiibacter arcticus TaxID=1579316 RepID=UPI0005799287|nr:D-tagatose-bisphosphate aldolase, class II, non-catalytic subunit [Falsihalocynthiibacter arcticus]
MKHALDHLLALPEQHNQKDFVGITSVCSANAMVIEASLLEAADNGGFVLIEATCNQVNQDGGYTGMTPQDFRQFVAGIAASVDFPLDSILFGGDHLGPNPWRKLPASEAMAKACEMTAAYARAGFSKIHLDASMACADDVNPLPPKTVATRAAELAKVADDAARAEGHLPPAYIIGTEVPVPGGASEELDLLEVTTCEDVSETMVLHQNAFAALGLEEAFARSIGVVVQPGVEFGHANVIHFVPEKAGALSTWRKEYARVVFEAHSTDYQTPQALRALVTGGFAILKVGPGLTFALREAYYALDQIAGEICEGYDAGTLPAKLEQIMLAQPEYWQDYYTGTKAAQKIQRHYSYSDRIRYYWTNPEAVKAVDALFGALEGLQIPETLISQFMPCQYQSVALGETPALAKDLALANVRRALAPYSNACRNGLG